MTVTTHATLPSTWQRAISGSDVVGNGTSSAAGICHDYFPFRSEQCSDRHELRQDSVLCLAPRASAVHLSYIIYTLALPAPFCHLVASGGLAFRHTARRTTGCCRLIVRRLSHVVECLELCGSKAIVVVPWPPQWCTMKDRRQVTGTTAAISNRKPAHHLQVE